MAEVLSRSRDDQSQSYYVQSNPTSSSLKRSHSSRTSLLVGSPPSTSHRTASEPSFEHIGSLKRSLASSGSLAASRQSYSDFSQPQSNSNNNFYSQQPKLSFEIGGQQDTGLAFPAYDEVQFFHEDEPLDLPALGPRMKLPTPTPTMADATETTKTTPAALPTPPVPTRRYQLPQWPTTRPSNTSHRDMSTTSRTTGERKTFGPHGGTLCHSARSMVKGRASKMRHGERGPSRNTTYQPSPPRRSIGSKKAT